MAKEKALTAEERQQLSKELELIEKRVSNIYKTEINVKNARAEQVNALKQQEIAQKKLEMASQADEKIRNKLVQIAQKDLAIAQKKAELAEDLRKTELKASSNLGYTGRLMESLGKKSEFAKGIYEAMRQESLELAEGTKKSSGAFSVLAAGAKAGYYQIKTGLYDWWKGTNAVTKVMGAVGIGIKAASFAADAFGKATGAAGSAMKGLSKHSSSVVTNLTSGLSDMLEKIPLVGGLMAGLVKFWSGLLDLIIGVDDYVVKLGRNMGLSATQSRKMKDDFAAMAYNSDKLYVTSERLLEAQSEIAKTTGINNIMSKEILETNIELADYAGLEADTRMGLMNTARITGKTMKETTQLVLGQVKALEEATGVSFNQQQILKEAATLSGRLGLQFAKYPAQLAKSLLMTKAMGLDLKQLNSMADSFLDFESSISKEFEAQLLTGKDINLMKAREAFLNNDLATAAAEITRQVGDSNSFLKLNRIQQDSIADSMGMSAEQMADMLRQQELLSKFSARDQKDLLKKIDLMRQQGREAEAIEMLGSKEAYNNMINLSTQERLMLAIEKIKVSLVDFLTNSNIVDKIEGFIKYLSNPDNIRSMVKEITGYIAKIIDFVGVVTAGIIDAVANIGGIFASDEWEEGLEEKAEQVRDFSSMFSKNVGKFEIGSTKKVDDAIIYPDGRVIQPSVEDTIIATKSGGVSVAKSEQGSNTNFNEMVSAFAAAMRQQPINVNSTIAVDGINMAKAVPRVINNVPVTSFDRQSGPLSLNAYYG